MTGVIVGGSVQLIVILDSTLARTGVSGTSGGNKIVILGPVEIPEGSDVPYMLVA